MSLDTVFCYAETPPAAESAFYKTPVQNVILKVPTSSLDKYREAYPWNLFGKILSSSQFTLKYYIDGNEYKSVEIEEGDAITPEPAPTKEGHTFSGWSEIPEVMPAHDVTVTGGFSINSYTLTYMIDGNVYKAVEYEYGATIHPEPQPNGDYATFEWLDLPQTMPAHDVTVYASYTSGVAEIIVTQKNAQIYGPDGRPRKEQQKGLNIVILDKGQTRKVVVK